MREKLEEYIEYLRQEEKSYITRRQYRRDIMLFLDFAEETAVCRNSQNRDIEEATLAMDKEIVLQYKQQLIERQQPASVNVKLAALNGFFTFVGCPELRTKLLRVQRKVYCSRKKELTKQEYLQLLETAKRERDERLALLLQTICGTGIRVSELQFITAEAVESGEAVIRLKGKTRVILLTGKLKKILKAYLKQKRIASGPVFVTRTGRPLDRSNIWKMMKRICKKAKVDTGKVFPHNLRHLFARCFYAVNRDISKLADILGHSSVDTTRIYIISSGYEHRKQMEALGLVTGT